MADETGMGAGARGALGAGAAVLLLLSLALGGVSRLRMQPSLPLIGMATLFLYVFGFSIASGLIDAGTGALTLFGAVQITMFAGALVQGERITHWCDTRALPAIWTEQAKFKEGADKLQTETAKLSAAAKTGNLDSVKTAFGSVGQTCKACHDAYQKN